MKTKSILCSIVLGLASASAGLAQGTAFTYQGRLNDGGAPANGSYDLQFIVYDSNPGGNQQGPILTNAATAVSNGLFTVILDFGQVFPGANRWLDIAVRTNGGSLFIGLSPRQSLTPTPYAITAGSVTSAGLAGTYGSALTLSNAANSFAGAFAGNGANVTNVNAATLGGLNGSNFWQLGGNNVASGQILGSTNNQPVQILVNNQQVMQWAYASNYLYGISPNVIAGISANSVGAGLVGATIIGGGGGQTNEFNPNTVTEHYGTVLGGAGNTAGYFAIAGGAQSVATEASSVALGQAYALGQDSVAMGDGIATGNYAAALNSSRADGDFSFAVGYLAEAEHDGCFVWADESESEIDFASTQSNQFLIRAAGGVGIGLNAPTAALHVASSNASPQLQITQDITNDYTRLRMNVSGSPFWEMDVNSGTNPALSFWNVSERVLIDYSGNITAKSFNPSSDRNLKENFRPVSALEVLDKVAALPITRWNFKEETATPHIGPMAQDFYSAFAVGMDDKHIATVDEGGVALAAIQGLNQRLNEKDAEIQNLKQQNDLLAERLNELEASVRRLAAPK